MVLQHILFSVIAKSILPLAAFEQQLINPSAAAVGLEPPCFAAGLAKWYEGANPLFDSTSLQWPAEYADDCVDCPAALLPTFDQDATVTVTAEDAMITAYTYPTESPTALTFTLEATTALRYTQSSSEPSMKHASHRSPANCPASPTNTRQAAPIAKYAASPGNVRTPTEPPYFYEGDRHAKSCKSASKHISLDEYILRFMFAVSCLAFLILYLCRPSGIKTKPYNMRRTVRQRSTQSKEEMQLAVVQGVHFLPGRIINWLQKSILGLRLLIINLNAQIRTLRSEKADLARQLANEKAKNRYFTQLLADKDAHSSGLEQDLLRALLLLADKNDQVEILKYAGQVSCHQNACLQTENLQARGLLLVKTTQVQLLSSSNTDLNDENSQLKAQILCLESKGLALRGQLLANEIRIELLSFCKTHLEEEKIRLGDLILEARGDIAQLGHICDSEDQVIKSLNDWVAGISNGEEPVRGLQSLGANSEYLESLTKPVAAPSTETKVNQQPNLPQAFSEHEEKIASSQGPDKRLPQKMILATLKGLTELLGVKVTPRTIATFLDLSSSTVFVYDDPAREDKYLRAEKFGDYSKGSNDRRNNLRKVLTNGSAESLKIDKETGRRLPDLQRRRRNSISCSEPKLITDSWPSKSDRAQTKWMRREEVQRDAKFSAKMRLEAINKRSKTQHDQDSNKDLLFSGSTGTMSEYRQTPREHRFLFFDDMFGTRSQSLQFSNYSLTDVLMIDKPTIVENDRITTVMESFDSTGKFDASRTIWSTPEIRCFRFWVRQVGKERRSLQAAFGMPPRVSTDNPRSGDNGKHMTSQHAVGIARKTILDRNTINTSLSLSRPRSFYFEHGEQPTTSATWAVHPRY